MDDTQDVFLLASGCLAEILVLLVHIRFDATLIKALVDHIQFFSHGFGCCKVKSGIGITLKQIESSDLIVCIFGCHSFMTDHSLTERGSRYFTIDVGIFSI